MAQGLSDRSDAGRTATHDLRTHNLSVHYGNHCAFQDVSITIPPQQITAVIGPSGCGKTSFLSTFNRMTDLLDQCRVSGQLWIDGKDILAKGVDLIQLRRDVGMIFQAPNPFPMSVKKNIQLPLKEMGVRNKTELDRITERVLSDAGLWQETKDRLHRSAQNLSGGQQQRLCIARALALQPKVLLFDEPCSALDPISSGVVEDLIHGLKQQTTIVIVTHNIAQARRIADRIALFWFQDGAGRLVECCDVGKAFSQPDSPITSAYLNGSRG